MKSRRKNFSSYLMTMKKNYYYLFKNILYKFRAKKKSLNILIFFTHRFINPHSHSQDFINCDLYCFNRCSNSSIVSSIVL